MTLGALTGAVALTAGRMRPWHAISTAARVLATLIAPLVIAISFHFLLALPDGRLTRPTARALVASATPAPSAPGSAWPSRASRSRSRPAR